MRQDANGLVVPEPVQQTAEQTYVVDQLARAGVSEAQILAKTLRATIGGLDLDDIVALSGDLKSIESGAENAANLFPAGRQEAATMDLKDKLKARVEATAKPTEGAKPTAAAAKASHELKVSLGPNDEPFTWHVKEGLRTYVVKDNGTELQCD